jgi:hypothetical protein
MIHSIKHETKDGGMPLAQDRCVQIQLRGVTKIGGIEFIRLPVKEFIGEIGKMIEKLDEIDPSGFYRREWGKRTI